MIYKIKALLPYFDNETGSKRPLKESPYRMVEVEENYSLYDLACLILESFEFDNDHLFGFYDNVNNRRKSKKAFELKVPNDLDYGSNNGDVKTAKVSEMYNKKGETWLFLFDFGDKWDFRVKFIDLVNKEEKRRYPRITEKFMEAPEQYPNYEE